MLAEVSCPAPPTSPGASVVPSGLRKAPPLCLLTIVAPESLSLPDVECNGAGGDIGSCPRRAAGRPASLPVGEGPSTGTYQALVTGRLMR